MAGLLSWFCICVTYIRFYAGLKVQRMDRTKLPYYSRLQPFAAWYGAVFCFLICFVSSTVTHYPDLNSRFRGSAVQRLVCIPQRQLGLSELRHQLSSADALPSPVHRRKNLEEDTAHQTGGYGFRYRYRRDRSRLLRRTASKECDREVLVMAGECSAMAQLKPRSLSRSRCELSSHISGRGRRGVCKISPTCIPTIDATVPWSWSLLRLPEPTARNFDHDCTRVTPVIFEWT